MFPHLLCTKKLTIFQHTKFIIWDSKTKKAALLGWGFELILLGYSEQLGVRGQEYILI